ncbi:MAG: carboxypeptidase-like regulatory domain-containing protein [Thermoplasmata archaeon]
MRNRLISVGILGLIVILGLLSAASLVAAQEHQISGNVYEEGTSWGIDGAEVHIEGDGSWDVNTDSSGYYSIWVPGGSYSIIVSANGYFDEDVWVTVEGENVNQDFYLSETYGNGNGGGGDDGDGDGDDGSSGIPDEFSQLGDQVGSYVTICMSIIIILVIAFLAMAIATVGIFVRLGKIKKELKKPPAQQAVQQYQQPLPPAQQAPPAQPPQPYTQAPTEQQSQPPQEIAPPDSSQ